MPDHVSHLCVCVRIPVEQLQLAKHKSPEALRSQMNLKSCYLEEN